MRLYGVFIDAIGAYLPEPVDVRTAVDDGRYDRELLEETGFRITHVAPETPALDMAVAAATTAIRRSSVEQASIDYFVHGGAYYQGPAGWPSTGYLLRELGLGDIPSVEVSQECNGMIAGIEVAVGQLTGAAARETALITTATNVSTPLVDRWREFGPQTIFGDGAAAVLLSVGGGFAEILSLNSATLPEAEGWQRGAESLLPPREGEGWRMNLVQRAIEYAGETGGSMQGWLDATVKQGVDLAHRSLAEAGVGASEVSRVLTFHSARYAIEEAVLGPLGIPLERSNWECGRSIGHLGPCDHIVSMDKLLRSGELGPGDLVLIVSWGAGWTTSTAVLRILATPPWLARDNT